MFGEPGVGVGLIPSDFSSVEPIMVSSAKEKNSVMTVTYAKIFMKEKQLLT